MKFSSLQKGSAEYLASHYLLSKRNKSSFWHHYSNNVKMTPEIKEKISFCKNPFSNFIFDKFDFGAFSWAMMVVGMNYYNTGDSTT